MELSICIGTRDYKDTLADKCSAREASNTCDQISRDSNEPWETCVCLATSCRRLESRWRRNTTPITLCVCEWTWALFQVDGENVKVCTLGRLLVLAGYQHVQVLWCCHRKIKWCNCSMFAVWNGTDATIQCYERVATVTITVLCLRQKCHHVYTPIIATLHLAWRLTLARRGRLSNILAWCHHAQMSAWQGCAVPCRLLHAGHRCCWQAASQVGHTANDGGATTSAIHCWPLSIHRACKAPWSGTPCPTTSAHSRTMSPLDSAWKSGFSLATSVLGALETSWQLRYINSHLPLPSPLPLVTLF